MQYENQILHGECLPLLKTFPSGVFDSFISDVPYGLGDEPTIEEVIAYLQGADLVTGDFMGKDWDIPSVPTWKEIYRVLKPGAYVLVFAGTRTWDLISMGLRAAGFKYRDTIPHNFPALMWTQSQGMPKNHNVGKAIDKKLGKKRTEVIGVKPGHEDFVGRGDTSSIDGYAKGAQSEGFSRPWMSDPEKVEDYHLQKAPASEEAAQWEDWGTGLKPSWEPILVFRKPLEGTVAENVLKHGTGAMNIGASRVKHSSAKDFEAHKKQVEAIKEKGGQREDSWKNSSDLSGANEVTAAGRWPANMVFSHSEDCQYVGVKQMKRASGDVKGTEPSPTTGDVYGKYAQRSPSKIGEDGQEPFSHWECVPGCPVAELDAQSGNRPSTLAGRADPSVKHEHPGTEFNPNSTFLGERTHHSPVYADEGGASRFFQQFDGVPFRYVAKANRKEAGGGVFKVMHPTLKPLKLMRYLVKLVTRPGGIVLDSYCGSGSTCHAAVLEGVRYVGIEREQASYGEAILRLQIIQKQEDDRRHEATVLLDADDEVEAWDS